MTKKIKVTRNSLYNPYFCGYCDLQYLLRYQEPFGYNSGVYGWNYDAYFVGGMTICTGYRNMPGKSLEKCGEYEEKARAILENHNLKYEEQRELVNALLDEFIEINL